MQDTSQVYRDQILTNVFLQYPAKGFVADQILPTLNVPDLTGVAFQLDESHLVAPVDTKRAAFARANRVNFNLTATSYGPLEEHTLETGITDQIMALYKEPVTPETNATNVVANKLLIEKEQTVMTQLTTAGNYNASNKVTLANPNRFDEASGDPAAVAAVARRAILLGCGNVPNVVVMNPDVRDALRNNVNVKARIQYSTKLTLDELDAQIADLLGVERILVASAVTSNQTEGSTTAGTKSFIWPDSMVFAYVADAPALEEISFGYLLRLNPEHNFSNPASFVGVDKWYEQQRKSTFVRANDFYLPWTVAKDAGYLVTDCTAAF
jgi:hypothetical protein